MFIICDISYLGSFNQFHVDKDGWLGLVNCNFIGILDVYYMLILVRNPRQVNPNSFIQFRTKEAVSCSKCYYSPWHRGDHWFKFNKVFLGF